MRRIQPTPVCACVSSIRLNYVRGVPFGINGVQDAPNPPTCGGGRGRRGREYAACGPGPGRRAGTAGVPGGRETPGALAPPPLRNLVPSPSPTKSPNPNRHTSFFPLLLVWEALWASWLDRWRTGHQTPDVQTRVPPGTPEVCVALKRTCLNTF